MDSPEVLDRKFKELLQRRSINGAYHALREGSFFEHFLVVGLSPNINKKPNKKEVTDNNHENINITPSTSKDDQPPVEVLPQPLIQIEDVMTESNSPTTSPPPSLKSSLDTMSDDATKPFDPAYLVRSHSLDVHGISTALKERHSFDDFSKSLSKSLDINNNNPASSPPSLSSPTSITPSSDQSNNNNNAKISLTTSNEVIKKNVISERSASADIPQRSLIRQRSETSGRDSSPSKTLLLPLDDLSLSPTSGRRRSTSTGGPTLGANGGILPPNLRRDGFVKSHKKKKSWIDVDTDDDGNKLSVEILYKFPPNKEIPFEAVPFCFPHEKQIKKVRQRGSFSQIHNAMYGQLRLLEKSKNSFIFIFVKDRDVYYGTCVMNKELLRRWPSFASTDALSTSDEIHYNSLTDCSSFVTRIYCFISKFPFFKLHYDILFSILGRERLYILEESAPSFTEEDSESKSQKSQKSQNKSQSPTIENKENEIVSILKSYYAQRVPRTGESLRFKLPGEVHSLEFTCPDADEDKLVADWCLPVLFKALKLETILTLLAAAIQEHSILIHCSNPGVLSSIVLSIICLLRPFVWQGPLIPILPSDLYEYLQSPVPYLVGVLSLPDQVARELTDTIIVKIEKRSEELTLPSRHPISLPHHDKLLSNLRPYHTSFFQPTGVRYHDPYKTKSNELEVVQKIISEFEHYHGSVLEAIKPHIKPGILQILDKSKLLNSIPKKYRDFFTVLLDTQQFSEFLQHFSIMQFEEEQTTQVVLARVEEKIQQLEKQKKEALEKVRECEEQIDYLRGTQKSLLVTTKETKSVGLIRASIEHLTGKPMEKKEEKAPRARGHQRTVSSIR